MTFIQSKTTNDAGDEFVAWHWKCLDCDTGDDVPLTTSTEEMNEIFARHNAEYHSPHDDDEDDGDSDLTPVAVV